MRKNLRIKLTVIFICAAMLIPSVAACTSTSADFIETSQQPSITTEEQTTVTETTALLSTEEITTTIETTAEVSEPPIDPNIPCVTKDWIGKWQDTSDPWTTLNIIADENTVRMNVTFEDSGIFNSPPVSFYEKDGEFCFEFNDEPWRMIYKYHLENGELLCTVIYKDGSTTDTKYKKVSDIPDDLKFKYIPNVCPGTGGKTRLSVLKQYAEYSKDLSNPPLTYEYTFGEPVPDIVNEYKYSDYIGKYHSPCDELAFSLLDFICANFQHTSNSNLGDDRTVAGIINVCRANDGKTNCRGLSIILSGLLRMNGIKASLVTCMPYENPFNDCHVVVDCLLPSGARVMLDPTYHLYLTDESGAYVSVQNLRKILIDGGKLTANKDFSYNGQKSSLSDYRNYMIKNTFRFSRDEKFYDGGDSKEKSVELIPVGYPVENVRSNSFTYNEDDFWNIK